MEKKIRKLTFEEADEEHRNYFMELDDFNKPIIKKITLIKTDLS